MKKYSSFIGLSLLLSTSIFSILVIVCYFLFYQQPTIMYNWFQHIALPWGEFWSFIWQWIPFSVAELCWTIAILLGFSWVIGIIFLVVKRPSNWKKQLLWYCISILCAISFVWAGYTCFWAVGYRQPAFYSVESGLSSQPISVEDLTKTTKYFAMQANTYAEKMPRVDGIFTPDILPLFSQTDELYKQLEQEFPKLQAPMRRAKPMLYSPILSRFGFTGFYFPFTGEANVNIHSPASMVPVTIAHELAHQRGVVLEDEANFTAIAACLSQPNIIFQYSASLFGYIHLSNALLSASPQTWQEISDSLNPLVKQDLEHNNQFWANYQSPISDAAESVYGGFLQSHGENRGLNSYGDCVNLLVAYYQNKIPA